MPGNKNNGPSAQSKRKFDHKAAATQSIQSSPIPQRNAKKQQTHNNTSTKGKNLDVDDQQMVSIGSKSTIAIQPKKSAPVSKQQPQPTTKQQPKPQSQPPPQQQQQKQPLKVNKKQPVVVESESEEEEEDPYPDDEDDEDFLPGEGELDVNPFSPDFFAHLFGGEGEMDPKAMQQLMTMFGGAGEGDEEDGEEGEDDAALDYSQFLNGKGELDYEAMMGMMGEGEFDFGEGEFDGEGDFHYDDSDEDDEDDEEANRSENDDLDELLSLEAPAKKNVNQAKGKKDAPKSKSNTKSSMNDDDGDDDDDDDDGDDDDIQAEFNFHDPDNDKDWHAVKRFIGNLIDKKDFNASEFADIITQQPQVGTMIKCPDAGEEPLGFITALSFNQHKEKQSMKQVKDYILNNAGNDKNKKQIQQLFATANVGLLLTDRLVNLPMEVVPPLYNELIKDIDFAKRELKQNKKLSQAEQQQWDFKYYILISQSSDSIGSTAGGKKKGVDKADAAAAGGVGNVWYTRFEDEFFSKHAQMMKKVPTSQNKAWLETGKLPVSNIIMVLPATALPQVRDHLATVIGMGGEEHFV